MANFFKREVASDEPELPPELPVAPPPPPVTIPEVIPFPDHWKIFPSVNGKTEPVPLPPALPTERTRILIAEDEPVSREVLALRLDQLGYQVIVTRDGNSALEELRKPDAPEVAILDWMMPEISGIEICRRMREIDKAIYLILLTARAQKDDIVEGLDAGADDYVVKPFQTEELHARIRVGLRIIGLQRALAGKVSQLEQAINKNVPMVGDL